MSSETTVDEDLSDPEKLLPILWQLAETVARRMKKASIAGGGVGPGGRQWAARRGAGLSDRGGSAIGMPRRRGVGRESSRSASTEWGQSRKHNSVEYVRREAHTH